MMEQILRNTENPSTSLVILKFAVVVFFVVVVVVFFFVFFLWLIYSA